MFVTFGQQKDRIEIVYKLKGIMCEQTNLKTYLLQISNLKNPWRNLA